MSNIRNILVSYADKKFDIELDLETTVEDFKVQIYSLTSIPPENQKIVGLIKGSILKNDSVLKDLDIKNGQKVIVIGKPESVSNEESNKQTATTSTATTTSTPTASSDNQVKSTQSSLNSMTITNNDIWMEECTRIYFHRAEVLQLAFRHNQTSKILCYACSTTCHTPNTVQMLIRETSFSCQCPESGNCLFAPRVDSADISASSKNAIQLKMTAAVKNALARFNRPENDRMRSMIESNYKSVQNYEQPALQKKALDLVPNAIRFNRKGEPIEKGEEQMRELLSWFKNTFFKWVDAPPCDFCNTKTVNVGHAPPNSEESFYKAGTVELYKCQFQHPTRFPRYNDPTKLLETRRGRCGEWANTFTLFCRALGYRARYILDLTDHVWTEIWSEKENRWIHCDSCEPAYDKPLTYESGWGKKLTYVFAFEVDGIFDVTRRYTTKLNEIMQRRTMVEENWLKLYLDQLNYRLRTPFDAVRKDNLIKREQLELVELNNSQNRSIGNDLLPRQSGSDEWKTSRGETGSQLSNINKNIHIQKSIEKGLPPVINNLLYKYEHNQSNHSKLNLIGNCKTFPDRIELTPKANDQVGAFWIKDKLKVTDGFIVRIRFINGTSGADGMAFVLQNHSQDIIGKRGSGLGYDGIENSLAVEFDSYSSVDSCNDPNGNHISIHCNGERKNSSHHQYSLAHATPVDNIPINDGKIHHAVISYNGKEKTLSIWYDQYFLLTDVKVDLDKLLDLPGGEAWIGMTAATGGLSQHHHILNFEFGTN